MNVKERKNDEEKERNPNEEIILKKMNVKRKKELLLCLTNFYIGRGLNKGSSCSLVFLLAWKSKFQNKLVMDLNLFMFVPKEKKKADLILERNIRK